MRIGIDLDNTIVCYDGLFHQVAARRGLIPTDVPTDKQAVRDFLRAEGRNDDWTELQGTVYGTAMCDAKPFPGFAEFMAQAVSNGHDIFVISHRTRYPYAGPQHDLHQAARDWLAENVAGLQEQHVFLEETLEAKLQRVSTQCCDVFIDDLPELLLHAKFPIHVQRILFDPANRRSVAGVERAASWHDLIARSFKGTAT